jgi:hypothetical protein
VSTTANSSGELTNDFLDKVLFPELGAIDGELQRPARAVCDAFSGHFDKKFKERNKLHTLLAWLMMHGSITPKFQPLDVLVNKVLKGYFRDLFEEWTLHAPINAKTSYPYPPSRQLLSC